MEIMIVVSIIALLAAIAVPAFMRARQQAQNTKFMNALRVATGAVEQYAIEHSRYPKDVNRATVPSGMASYLDPTLDWTGTTPIGGQWDWDFDVFGVKAAICVVGPSVGTEQLEQIDSKFDDGNLSTGRFRSTAPGRYADIVEE